MSWGWAIGAKPAAVGWARPSCYDYAQDGNRLLATSLPGDDVDDPQTYSDTYAHDVHGSMTAMPSIPGGLTWDPQDRLQKTDHQGDPADCELHTRTRLANWVAEAPVSTSSSSRRRSRDRVRQQGRPGLAQRSSQRFAQVVLGTSPLARSRPPLLPRSGPPSDRGSTRRSVRRSRCGAGPECGKDLTARGDQVLARAAVWCAQALAGGGGLFRLSSGSPLEVDGRNRASSRS